MTHVRQRGTMRHMSDTALRAGIPPWTLGWRLKRALAFANLTTERAAELLDVDRSTISRWQNDVGKPPKRIFLREFASVTGVPYEWLLEGDEPHGDGDSHGELPGSTFQSSVFADRQGSLMARIGSLQMAS